VIYRAERKKILHSQLFLIDTMINIAETLLAQKWTDFDRSYKSLLLEKSV